VISALFAKEALIKVFYRDDRVEPVLKKF